jgi:hypothetical protein
VPASQGKSLASRAQAATSLLLHEEKRRLSEQGHTVTPTQLERALFMVGFAVKDTMTASDKLPVLGP